ncbi:MAG: hypothetical protein AB2L13_21005 [Spirochaetota bacterium]
MGLLKKVKKAVKKVTAPAVKQITASVAPVVQTVIAPVTAQVSGIKDIAAEIAEVVKDPSIENLVDVGKSTIGAVTAQLDANSDLARLVKPITQYIPVIDDITQYTILADDVKEFLKDPSSKSLVELAEAQGIITPEMKAQYETVKAAVQPYIEIGSAMYNKLKSDSEGQRFLSDVRDYIGDVKESVEKQLDSIFKFIGWA